MLRLEESHSQKHHIALYNLLVACRFHLRAATVRIRYPLYSLHLNAFQVALAVIQELVGCKAPAALATLLMAGCGLEDVRPLRPGSCRVVTNRRLGHDLNLGNAYCTLTMASSNAVAAGITAAYHKYLLATGRYGLIGTELLSGQTQVLLCKHLQGKIYALKLTSGNLQVTCSRCTVGNDVCVKALGQFVEVNRCVELELDSLLLHDGHTAVNHVLVKLEVGYSVTYQSAGRRHLVIQGHLITKCVKTHRGTKSGRTCTYDSHTLTVTLICLGLDVTLAESMLYDGALVLTDGHGSIDAQVQGATLLAECGADTARKLGEVICGREQFICKFPLAFIYCILPFRLFVA